MYLHIHIVFAIVFSTKAVLSAESFSEELFIKPFASNQLYAHFQFTTQWNSSIQTENFRHTNIFPRSLGELLVKYDVQELHISLTMGMWRYETWGYPIHDASPGAEVWAWFKSTTKDVNKNWKQLTTALSSLLCASFNFVDKSNSVMPKYSFRQQGVVPDDQLLKSDNQFVRYAALPREIVCTENLTPWKKLLPCRSDIGLSSLLNSGYVYDTRYHSLALHIRPVCQNKLCSSDAIELQQTISLVFDHHLMLTKDWSLRKLFGQGIMGPCPLSSLSKIYVETTNHASKPYTLAPNPDDPIISMRGGQKQSFASYNIKTTPMSISAKYAGKQELTAVNPPPLFAFQYVSGYGRQRGSFVVSIHNTYWEAIRVVVMQVIPWYFPVFIHSMRVISNGEELKPIKVHFVAGRARSAPYHLETVLKLPPRSDTSVTIDFEHVFLKWYEYPPDANHGFYVPSAVISAMLPVARNFSGIPQDAGTIFDSFNASRYGYFVRIRTEPILITLPTPDFSMPYNVICLACTVIALAFGPIHNITTKRLVFLLEPKTSSIKSMIDKIKQKVFRTKTEKTD